MTNIYEQHYGVCLLPWVIAMLQKRRFAEYGGA